MTLSSTELEAIDIAGLNPDDGEYSEPYFVIELFDYDTFNNVYNRLEKNIEFERDSDETSLNDESAHITYVFKDLLVELVAIFDSDNYSFNLYKED